MMKFNRDIQIHPFKNNIYYYLHLLWSGILCEESAEYTQ